MKNKIKIILLVISVILTWLSLEEEIWSNLIFCLFYFGSISWVLADDVIKHYKTVDKDK